MSNAVSGATQSTLEHNYYYQTCGIVMIVWLLGFESNVPLTVFWGFSLHDGLTQRHYLVCMLYVPGVPPFKRSTYVALLHDDSTDHRNLVAFLY